MLNLVVRVIFINLANCMGYQTESQKYNFVKNMTFYATLFQTAFLFTLAAWDLSALGNTFGKLFGGMYTDFNNTFFTDVAPVIFSTCQAQVQFPLVEFFGRYILRHMVRIMD
jgi:hypothetical protein